MTTEHPIQRTKGIIAEHSLLFPDGDVDHGECAYGDWTGHWQDHPAHVAAVITEQLDVKPKLTPRQQERENVRRLKAIDP